MTFTLKCYKNLPELKSISSE